MRKYCVEQSYVRGNVQGDGVPKKYKHIAGILQSIPAPNLLWRAGVGVSGVSSISSYPALSEPRELINGV